MSTEFHFNNMRRVLKMDGGEGKMVTIVNLILCVFYS